MDRNKVILVNERDEAVGSMDKIAAHQQGALHRAFSIFIFNSNGELLLQQRADDKYHSAGLWTNSCCSHPQPGEDTVAAAQARLAEEMGFTVSLEKIFDFVYRADMENGLVEYEFDHVFTGEYDGPVPFNKEEVKDYRFKNMPDISQDIERRPEHYTAWFRLAFPGIERWWKAAYKEALN